MRETEWFSGRGVDEPPRTTPLAWIIFAVAVAAFILAPLVLAGCTTVEGICAVQPIGKTDGGIEVYRYRCEPS